jgi:copper homeostasis protein
MPGSGVNASNIVQIAESTGDKEFHSSASYYTESKMKYHNSLMNESLQHIMVNKEEVKAMVILLKEHGN